MIELSNAISDMYGRVQRHGTENLATDKCFCAMGFFVFLLARRFNSGNRLSRLCWRESGTCRIRSVRSTNRSVFQIVGCRFYSEYTVSYKKKKKLFLNCWRCGRRPTAETARWGNSATVASGPHARLDPVAPQAVRQRTRAVQDNHRLVSRAVQVPNQMRAVASASRPAARPAPAGALAWQSLGCAAANTPSPHALPIRISPGTEPNREILENDKVLRQRYFDLLARMSGGEGTPDVAAVPGLPQGPRQFVMRRLSLDGIRRRVPDALQTGRPAPAASMPRSQPPTRPPQ